MSLTVLDQSIIDNTVLEQDPFPHIVVPQAIRSAQVANVIRDFPNIKQPGSFPFKSLPHGPAFQALADEICGTGFRTLIGNKFGVDLTAHPTMLTLRGFMRSSKDGRIHTDSKDKLITVLFYLNEDWNQSGGKLRILRGGNDINDYVSEVTPLAGTMVAFRVTPDCWHGHLPCEGIRRSVQLNFMVSQPALDKHEKNHRRSSRLKRLKALIGLG